MNLLGEYEVTLDTKGRFLLPAGLKKRWPEGGENMVIARGFEKSLLLYPMGTWEKVAEKFLKLNDFNPKVREFKTLFLGGATFVELDTAGRLLIPPSLKEHAALTKDIMLIGELNKVKMVDAGAYKKFFEQRSEQDFSDLGKEVLGDEILDFGGI